MLANEQGDLYWLDGGAEQIVFYPSADKFANTRDLPPFSVPVVWNIPAG